MLFFLRRSLLIPVLALLFALPASAGTVHSCKTSYKKVKGSIELVKKVKCVAQLSNGSSGDTVEFKNHYNYITATGRIVKRKGRYVLVVLKDIYKDVKSGYAVSIRNNDSIDHWTATTAPF